MVTLVSECECFGPRECSWERRFGRPRLRERRRLLDETSRLRRLARRRRRRLSCRIAVRKRCFRETFFPLFRVHPRVC